MKLTDITNSFLRSNNKPMPASNDLGLGDKIMTGGGRLINKDGSFNIVREDLTVLEFDLLDKIIEIQPEEKNNT